MLMTKLRGTRMWLAERTMELISPFRYPKIFSMEMVFPFSSTIMFTVR